MNRTKLRIFDAKNRTLGAKIKVGAVSYLNTKPLLYGIENGSLSGEIELVLDYPAQLAQSLQNNDIDLALLPVAAIPGIAGARIVSDYGIAADGKVASVAVFSQVPMEEIETVYLDYQSRTSVRLAQLLFEKHWKKKVIYKHAPENYIEYINGNTAGVIIGDRALKQLNNFEYIYDLAEGWKELTGLPFVFAAWVANKELPTAFIKAFNEANAVGLAHIDEIVAANPFPYYDLNKYYRENIEYLIDEPKKKGLDKFIELINN
jgi:chorismate dehydratase